jgi:hypothetical protein
VFAENFSHQRANRPNVVDAMSRVLEEMLTDGSVDVLIDKCL